MLSDSDSSAVGRTGSGDDTEGEDVRRRTFLRAFAAAGACGALGAAGIEALRHELLTAIGGDPADVADWEAIAWEYGRTFGVAPPAVLAEDLALDLLIARERLRGLRDEGLRIDLLRVMRNWRSSWRTLWATWETLARVTAGGAWPGDPPPRPRTARSGCGSPDGRLSVASTNTGDSRVCWHSLMKRSPLRPNWRRRWVCAPPA